MKDPYELYQGIKTYTRYNIIKLMCKLYGAINEIRTSSPHVLTRTINSMQQSETIDSRSDFIRSYNETIRPLTVYETKKDPLKRQKDSSQTFDIIKLQRAIQEKFKDDKETLTELFKKKNVLETLRELDWLLETTLTTSSLEAESNAKHAVAMTMYLVEYNEVQIHTAITTKEPFSSEGSIFVALGLLIYVRNDYNKMEQKPVLPQGDAIHEFVSNLILYYDTYRCLVEIRNHKLLYPISTFITTLKNVYEYMKHPISSGGKRSSFRKKKTKALSINNHRQRNINTLFTSFNSRRF